jgi:hypothetical protein
MKTVSFTQYQDACERILRYNVINKKMPTSVLVDGEKISQADYTDAIKRVQAYIESNGKPKTVRMGTAVTSTSVTPPKIQVQTGVYVSPKWKHNMDQDTKYYCAPFVDAQILYELYGIDVAEKYLAEQAGTTTSGTGHPGIISAVTIGAAKYGHSVQASFQNFSDTGWKLLGEMVADPNIGIGLHVLYRNHIGWGHYMYPVLIDLNKKIITCIDSLNDADTITVSFAEFEKWIANTPGGQPSVFKVKKLR